MEITGYAGDVVGQQLTEVWHDPPVTRHGRWAASSAACSDSLYPSLVTVAPKTVPMSAPRLKRLVAQHRQRPVVDLLVAPVACGVDRHRPRHLTSPTPAPVEPDTREDH
jgi:hypothetical protein